MRFPTAYKMIKKKKCYLFLKAGCFTDNLSTLWEGRRRTRGELERVPLQLMSSLGDPQELVDDESIEDGEDDDGSDPD